jgi:hypothetical protein
MRKLLTTAVILFIGLTSGNPCVGEIQEQQVTKFRKMSKTDLQSKLNDPDIVLLDVRIDLQWRVSEYKLPGAVHEDPKDVASWSKKYPKDKKMILY